MQKEYRIQPVQVPVHGLKDEGFLSEPQGYELLRRDGIRLISMGIYPSEEAAKVVARRHAGKDTARFV
jgi:hypothetical protein